MDEILNTREAAKRLGVSVRRVQAMIKAKRLPAQRLGREWIIDAEDLKLVKDRKPGRPPLQRKPTSG